MLLLFPAAVGTIFSPSNVIIGPNTWRLPLVVHGVDSGDRVSLIIVTKRSSIIPNIIRAIEIAHSWISDRPPGAIDGSGKEIKKVMQPSILIDTNKFHQLSAIQDARKYSHIQEDVSSMLLQDAVKHKKKRRTNC